MRTILFVYLVFVLSNCINPKKDNSDNSYISKVDSLDLPIQQFLKDSLGCLGLRTKKSIESIYYGREVQDKKYLISLLGYPNDSLVSKEQIYYKYFFNSICNKDIPIDSVDRCWASFQLNAASKRIKSLKFICQ
jgi:hypothetical protein